MHSALKDTKMVIWKWYEVHDFTESTYTTNTTLVNQVRSQVHGALANLLKFATTAEPIV